MALYTPDAKFTGAANEQRREDFRNDQWRNAFLGQADQWQQGRQGYAAALRQGTVNAGLPAARTAAGDARQQISFNSARRGLRGSSVDMASRSRAQQAFAARLAELLSMGRTGEQVQQGEDQEAAQAWRNQAFQAGPGQQVATQAQLDAERARQGQQGDLTQLSQQGTADRQAYQNYLSQLVGGQMTGAANTISTAGRLGYGPQWAQALGQRMAGV